MLIVEQHVDFALSVADRYAVLKLGEITDRGDVASPGARHHITDQLSI